MEAKLTALLGGLLLLGGCHRAAPPGPGSVEVVFNLPGAKKPLPLTILAVTLVLMLLVNFGALRLSSIVLMLAAAAVSLAVCAVRRKRGGEEK